jgi:chromosome segregation ATPase
MSDVEIIKNKLDALLRRRAVLARELETADESLTEARERLINAPDKRTTDTATVAQGKLSMLQLASAEVDARIAILETQLSEAQEAARAEDARACVEALRQEREGLQAEYNALRAELNEQLATGAARLRELATRHTQASREIVDLTPGAKQGFVETRIREETLRFGEAIITALQIVQHEEDRARIKASSSARSTSPRLPAA